MAEFTTEAVAALVFLIGYLAVFIWMLFAYLTHRIKWRSRYSLLFSHVAIRLASQGCGVAFGILGFSNTNLFLAYLVLGAEGYFSLVMCVFRFVISWHEHNLPSRSSWLEPRDPPGTKKFSTKALVDSMKLSYYRDHPMMCLHLALILANVAIVVGGSFLAGANFTDAEDKRAQMRLDLSKILRTAGQGVFLACNAILLGILLLTIRNNLRDGDSRRKKGSVHPTLYLLLISWFPLMVRGAFGVLQSAIFQFSYYNTANYTPSGFTTSFTTLEYLLGVLPEWLACVLLNLTYLTSRRDPKTALIVENTSQDVSMHLLNPV